MREFDERVSGSHGYIEITLATDLTDYDDAENIPPHKQVDVRLPHGKILRLPYAWLRLEGDGVPSPAKVLEDMLVESDAPPKKVTVQRAGSGK